MRSLHPSLAKIAIKYDKTIDDLKRKVITLEEANDIISSLRARDDFGRVWRINYINGRWEYKKVTGSWEEEEPPSYGIDGFYAEEFSGKYQDIASIENIEVDQEIEKRILKKETINYKRFSVIETNVTGIFIIILILGIIIMYLILK